MTGNRVVVYKGPGEVSVESVDYPKLELPEDVVNGLGVKRSAPHAAILKLVTTNICGSDQHMVRGRTTAPVGQTLGHEITGEVVEVGDDVLFVKEGDICSVPFNIACGRCRMCNEGKTGICVNVNPARAGAAYGYVDMGGWVGGQAAHVAGPLRRLQPPQVPRSSDQALAKIRDLAMLSDIFPTGYHGAVTAAGVTPGSTSLRRRGGARRAGRGVPPSQPARRGRRSSSADLHAGAPRARRAVVRLRDGRPQSPAASRQGP